MRCGVCHRPARALERDHGREGWDLRAHSFESSIVLLTYIARHTRGEWGQIWAVGRVGERSFIISGSHAVRRAGPRLVDGVCGRDSACIVGQSEKVAVGLFRTCSQYLLACLGIVSHPPSPSRRR